MTPVAIWFKDGFKFVPVDCSRDCHLAARRKLFAFLWGQPQNRPVFECEEGCVEMDGRDWLCHVFTITNNVLPEADCSMRYSSVYLATS